MTGPTCVVALRGPLDVGTRPELGRLVEYLLTAGVTEVVLDLGRVDFLNTAGVRALVYAWRRAVAGRAVLRIVDPPAQVRSVLDLTGASALLLGTGPVEPPTGVPHRSHATESQTWDARRARLQAVHRRRGAGAVPFLDDDFLAVAHRSTVLAAIVDACLTIGAADACDLQIHDPTTGTLRIEAQHGFGAEFLSAFASVGANTPTACAMALATRQPVLVDDVTRSPIFQGQPTLGYLRAAGTLAVRSYPLLTTGGEVYGVLSLHYRRPAPAPGLAELVAHSAALVLTRDTSIRDR